MKNKSLIISIVTGVLLILVIAFAFMQWRSASDNRTRITTLEQQNQKLLYTNGIACSLLSYSEAKNILGTKDALIVEASRVPAGIVSTSSNDFKPAIDTCGYRAARSDNVYVSFSLQQYQSENDAKQQFTYEKKKAVGAKDVNAAQINADEAFTITNSVKARRGNLIISVAVGRTGTKQADDAILAEQLTGKFIAIIAESSLKI